MKLSAFILTLLFSFQIMAHCGSCGMGDASDHSEGDDISHHEDDTKDQPAENETEAEVDSEDVQEQD